MKSFLESFLQYRPFYHIIHHYVDLNVFLIAFEKNGDHWWSLNRRKHAGNFFLLEVHYRGPNSKDAFLKEGFERVRREKRTLCLEHLGLKDFFVPVFQQGEVIACLLAGPFWEGAFTIERIAACWEAVSGRIFTPEGEDVKAFARTLLKTQFLERELQEAFQETLELFARLLSGEKNAAPIGERLEFLKCEIYSRKLPHSYFLDWTLQRPTREAVPPWSREFEKWEWIRKEIGLTRIPTAVIAVIPRRGAQGFQNDVEEMIHLHRLQYQSFLFARQLEETVGGELEDYGTVFVASPDPSLPRVARHQFLKTHAQRIAAFSEKTWGAPVAVGVGRLLSPGDALHPSYRQAVLAAHQGLKTGEAVTFYREAENLEEAPSAQEQLEEAKDALEQAVESGIFSALEEPEERLFHAVLNECFQNPGEARLHFRYVLEHLTKVAAQRMGFAREQSRALLKTVLAPFTKAVTFQELRYAFHRSLAELEEGILHPKALKTKNWLEEVTDILHRRFSMPVNFKQLAARAGVSYATFNRTFKKKTGLTPEHYLQDRRLKEAARLLKTTSLPVSRVAQAVGFKSVAHFVNVFHKKNGLSPQEYRLRHRKALKESSGKAP